MTTFTHIKFDENCDIIEKNVYNVLENKNNSAVIKREKCFQRRHIKFNENGDIIENRVYNVIKTNKNVKIIR